VLPDYADRGGSQLQTGEIAFSTDAAESTQRQTEMSPVGEKAPETSESIKIDFERPERFP